MKKDSTAAVHENLEALAEDAKALMAATADVAEEKVVAARKRLASALETGQGALGQLKERVVNSAKATDQMVRDHPYHAMGVAFGAGALLAYLLSRRNN